MVVAARTLEEGAGWVASRLGVETVAGGKHALMGTHNRLLGLGRDAYLEVIAIDPAAPAPGRARWFALDSPAMRSRLEKGPALIHWVARTDDIVAAARSAPVALGEVVAAERGDYRWRITVPGDGSLPAGGAFPTLIQWDVEKRPAAALAESGCRIESLELHHEKSAELLAALRTLGLPPEEPVVASGTGGGLKLLLRTPGGTSTLA